MSRMSNHPLSSARIDAAIAAGVVYLRSVQREDGSIPVDIASSEDMIANRAPSECLFGAALVASALVGCPQAAPVAEPACDFIAGERLLGWVWNYHFRNDNVRLPPPDVDDTALALHALAGHGRTVPRNLESFLANRDERGRFYTWFEPWRAGRLRLRLILGGWRQLLQPWRQREYFANSHSVPDDVDPGVNANVLNWLGRYDGDETVVEWLLQILRDGREATCDKYYHNPVVILYFFARALAARSDDARALLVARSETADSIRPVDLAMTIIIRSLCLASVPEAMVARLITAQAEDGSWPIGPLYCAGRHESEPGRFDEPGEGVGRFGSEAISTALAVSALNAIRAGLNAPLRLSLPASRSMPRPT